MRRTAFAPAARLRRQGAGGLACSTWCPDYRSASILPKAYTTVHRRLQRGQRRNPRPRRQTAFGRISHATANSSPGGRAPTHSASEGSDPLACARNVAQESRTARRAGDLNGELQAVVASNIDGARRCCTERAEGKQVGGPDLDRISFMRVNPRFAHRLGKGRHSLVANTWRLIATYPTSLSAREARTGLTGLGTARSAYRRGQYV